MSTYLPTAKVVGLSADADAIVSSTDQVVIAGLSRPVLAGQAFSFTAKLLVTSPADADIDIGLSLPAGATVTTSGRFFNHAAPSVPVAHDAEMTVATDGSEELIVITGFIQVGDEDGDFALSFAQNASNAGDTIVQKGSVLEITNLS